MSNQLTAAPRDAVNQMSTDHIQEIEEEEKWVTHYSSGHQILLVEEGCFSFSSSLASCFGSATNICASSLDSQDDVIKKYKNTKSNLDKLKELGASILHGVDATKMNQEPTPTDTCITSPLEHSDFRSAKGSLISNLPL